MNGSKIILVFLFIVFGIATTSVGQIIKGKAVLGLNLTQVEGDEVHGFKKPGVQIGVGAMIPFKENWDISLDVNFNQKGARQKDQYSETDTLGNVFTGAYKLRLNYVEIPLLLQYTDKDFITFGAGFSWGRLVGVQEWEHGKKVETTTLSSGTYSKNDFSYIIDIRIRVYGPLKLGVRYQNSMVKIRTREFEDFAGNKWTRDQFNKVLSFNLVYIFNEERSKTNLNAPTP